MARNRQRQRQAERRAARLAERGETPAEPGAGADPDPHSQSADTDEATAGLAAGAPPEELGRSDMVLEPAPGEPDLEDDDDVDPELVMEAEEAGALASVDLDDDMPAGPRGRRGGDDVGKGHATPAQEHEREHHRERGKVLTFLANVWAELQRVQWPNRQQVTTLTAVVLGFVLIAGGYLGLLDAIFSRVIKEIL